MVSVQQKICNDFNVSPATISNWIKTGIIPTLQNINTTRKYNEIIEKIRASQKLDNRANRNFSNIKYTVYLGIKSKERKELLNSLIEEFEKSTFSIEQGILALCYRQLEDEELIKDENIIFLNEWFNKFSSAEQTAIKNLFKNFYVPNLNDDIIGAFYQSVQNIAQKSSKGAFYTPAELLADIEIESDKTICDPCCGSGSIFLNVLSKNHDTKKIFAYDIDELAIKICRVNLMLFFNEPNINCHCELKNILDVQNCDYFPESRCYDYIITNPPWGMKFNNEEKKSLLKKYPELGTTESFSIALHNSINQLSENGILYFFLPYSILNVAVHRKIRKEIFLSENKISIKLLGHAFKGVLSEALLLKINSNTQNSKIQIEQNGGKIYQLEKQKIISPDFIIEAEGSELTEKILEKIYSLPHTTLKDNADFALGIVTGNNKKSLSQICLSEMEPIYKGNDIHPFTISEEKNYIKFAPEIFQQVADEHYYRSKKIVYRFINSRIICALDFDGKLLLNSANLFIPKNDYPFETIVCLFNSSIYNFIFQKKFHSAKILRSHLESMPLPKFSESQHSELKSLHDKFISSEFMQAELDEIIVEYLKLNNDELKYILEEVK